MKIYRGITEVLDLGFEPDGTEHKELMVEHTVQFTFELTEYVQLKKGDHITFNGEKFSLNRDYIPVINRSTKGYIYDLIFFDFTKRYEDYILKYSLQGVEEVDFTLTATCDRFIDIIIQSVSNEGLGLLVKGTYPSGMKEIHFENVDIFSGINLIAETFETEFWFDGNVLNFGKHEYGIPTVLEYDKEVDDISFSQSTEEFVTRIIAFGGTRNIPSGYRATDGVVDNIGEKRLRLPVGVDYVDMFPGLDESQIIERVKIFEHIFPRQKNSIIQVQESVLEGGEGSQETTIFTIKGNNSFIITENDIETGKPLSIAFTSGNLSGREFELIIRESNTFEIKYTQEGNNYIPNPTLKPEIGDEFFFFNFKADSVMPTLIIDAENELKEATEEFFENLGSELVYDVKNRSIYCEENEIDLGIGKRVLLKSETLGEIITRVRKYEKNILNPFECTYQVGDSRKTNIYDRLSVIAKETVTKSSGVNKEVLAELALLSTKYLSKIKPDSASEIITFLKGIKARGLSESDSLKVLEDLAAENGDIKSLTSATAIIDNITLHKGMSSEVFFPGFLGEGMELFLDENGNWNFTLDNLTVRKQMNVFELVINRIKHVGGAFLFSPAGGTFIEVIEYPEFWRCYVDKNNNEFEIYDQVICQTFTKNKLKRYWRLAVNVGEDFVDLSKTDCESGSAYPEMDDEAVTLGNRINNARQNAVLISSYGDDGSYQQFLNGVDTYSLADKIDIHFGKESFMRVNRLEIKGTDGKSERVPRDRGIFQLGETYEFYDRVVYNGRYWLCLAINTTSVPSEGEWQEQTNVRAGGKNLLREYDLRFDGKYWQGNYNGQFIDLSMLADYLFNGNNDAIVTENNLYIEI